MADEQKIISVGILEDDSDTREFLSELFRNESGFDVAFACETLAEALLAVETQRPDVALIDIRLPDGTGLEFIEPYKRITNGRALILTVLGDRASVLLAFEFGASGYLLKDTAPAQIIADIRALVRGGSPISPQAATHLLGLLEARASRSPATPIDNILTGRERDVLTMFSRGLSYKETARMLGISNHTIADHVKSIYAKMKVHSRNEAVFEAVQNGWLDL
jgi:DNA-binding NarL/FixJ family response regulator